jgi:hypothetical protein
MDVPYGAQVQRVPGLTPGYLRLLTAWVPQEHPTRGQKFIEVGQLVSEPLRVQAQTEGIPVSITETVMRSSAGPHVARQVLCVLQRRGSGAGTASRWPGRRCARCAVGLAHADWAANVASEL